MVNQFNGRFWPAARRQTRERETQRDGSPNFSRPIRSTQHATWEPRFPGGVPRELEPRQSGSTEDLGLPRCLTSSHALPVVRLRRMGTGRRRVAGSLSRLCRLPRLQQQNLRPWWPPSADQSHREHQLVTVPTPPQPRGRWGLGSGSGRPNRSCTSFWRPNDGQIGSSGQIMEMDARGRPGRRPRVWVGGTSCQRWPPTVLLLRWL